MGSPELRERLSRSGVEDGAARVAILGWLELLVTWNAKIDLTAARTDDELVDLMVADALALAPRLPPKARVVDVGSGAGAPGLAIALLRPDLVVTLCEPLAKRAAFLRTVLGTLGRVDVGLRRTCGEDLPAGVWDVAVSRATLPPAAWLALGERLAGDTWVLLAKEPPPPAQSSRIAEDVVYRWTLTGVERRAVRFTRAPEPR